MGEEHKVALHEIRITFQGDLAAVTLKGYATLGGLQANFEHVLGVVLEETQKEGDEAELSRSVLKLVSEAQDYLDQEASEPDRPNQQGDGDAHDDPRRANDGVWPPKGLGSG